MRSHFYSPQKIREMIASCGYSAKIKNDGRYTEGDGGKIERYHA
jgi:hypothetical protein